MNILNRQVKYIFPFALAFLVLTENGVAKDHVSEDRHSLIYKLALISEKEELAYSEYKKGDYDKAIPLLIESINAYNEKFPDLVNARAGIKYNIFLLNGRVAKAFEVLKQDSNAGPFYEEAKRLSISSLQKPLSTNSEVRGFIDNLDMNFSKPSNKSLKERDALKRAP